MKIALVESVPFPPKEGLGNYVWNLALQMTKRGHEVQIFTRGRARKIASKEVDGIQIHEAFRPELPPFHIHLHQRHIQRAIDENAADADIVHVHTPLPPPIKTRAPQILTFHTPIRSSVANLGGWNRTSTLQRLQSPIARTVEAALIRRATMVSAVSPSVAEDLRYYRLNPDEVRVLDNGIDPAVFKPGPCLREDFLLVTGRIAPRKGLPDLLTALSILKRNGLTPTLVITGQGPMRKTLETMGKNLGISDQLDFRGFVSREELVDLLQRCAIFAFPSHYEGLPTSVLEAMACGSPIVAAAAHGTRDLIVHNRNGITVEVGKPREFAACLNDLLGDPPLRDRLGQTARLDVETRFSWTEVSSKIEKQYTELISNPDPRWLP